MKTLYKHIFSLVLALGLLSGCANKDTYDVPSDLLTTYDLTTTKTVQEIKDIAVTANMPPVQIITDEVIEAYVTSSDEQSTFYKSISFQTIPIDGSDPIGFSVPINITTLYGEGFTPGRKVYIKLKNLYVEMVFGSLQIGYLYEGTIGRIPENVWKNHLFPSATIIDQDDFVRSMNLEDAYSDVNQHTLIELQGVQFSDSSINRTYYDIDSGGGATNHTLSSTVSSGSEQIIRFSSFAPFSGNQVPTASGNIRGVLTKYDDDFQFLVRYQSDIKLTSPRFLPLFQESFTSNFQNWIKFSVTGAQVWSLNTANGNPGNCADMNGFSSGAQTNEDWLISPAIDLTNAPAAFLSFQTAKNFSGNAIQVLVSTNYSGSGTPSAATWTQLTATIATASGFVWTNSNDINLQPYIGNNNFRVAFRYTSTSSAAAQWRVDNIKILPF